MQDHEARHPRHRLSAARLRGSARGAPLEEGTNLLRMLGVSRLQLRGVAASDPRAVPEVRSRLHHGADRQGPLRAHVREGRMRLQAGGRSHRRMKDPVAGFLRHLSVEKNASPHTLRSYRSDLADFTRSLQTTVERADSRDIRGFLVALHARGLDAVSVARKLAAVRSFYRFLVRRGVVGANPARETRGPRRAQKLVGFLPIDEATVLVDARALGGASRERDVAILELLYAT